MSKAMAERQGAESAPFSLEEEGACTSTSGVAEGEPAYALVSVYTPLQRKVVAPQDIPPTTEGEDPYTRVFHYAVPQALRERIRIGQLVWVPFHGRQVQGVVVGFDTSSPVDKALDIEEIVDPEPILSPLQLELARWISAYYLAPLHLVTLGMLPPGITQRVEVIISAASEIPLAPVTKGQAEILALLRAKGPLSLRQIVRLSRRKDARVVVNQLVSRGWATRRLEVLPSRARPRLEVVVRARADLKAEDYPPRAPLQRRALEYLAARGKVAGEWLPLTVAAREAGVPPATLRALAEKGLIELDRRRVWRDPLEGQAFVPVIPPRLTADQQAAWERIAEDLVHPAGRPFLLHGVTGSGKTEIYLRAVQQVLAQGRGAIVLVPEIALTPQTIRRFGARFPTTIAVLHSRLSPGERYDQWQRLRAGELRLVVGSRSAIFAPVRDLGLIILDEEHEWTYKQEKTPHYHAREVAIRLAKLARATCILGSATPDLESYYRAERGEYVYLRLPQRIMGHRHILEEQAAHWGRAPVRYQPAEGDLEEAMFADLPPVEVVDMRAELRAGNRSIFSRALQRGIESALAAGEQVILFINRRGEATFVICRDCGHVLKCPRCDLPLTYHSAGGELICHHCNYKAFAPSQCPNCWSERIRYCGAGTQRVEEAVRQSFPQARVVRWDLDTTGGKLDHERILDQFIRGEADIMVGTQMIAKGLDLPLVTLVGVVAADTMLNLPDFRAGERAFQLLTQVAGRAGRSILGGKVIIQTYTPHHPAIQAASRHDYVAFYEREIAFRRERWYPPISRLVQLIYSHSNAATAQREAEALHRLLTLKIARLGLAEVDLIGPAPAFFSRLRGQYRWQLLIRGKDPTALLRDMHLPLGWRVDVDPVSLL